MSNDNYQAITLFSRFREESAKSFAGLRDQFKIKGFVMGYTPSLINEAERKVQPVADNSETTENVLHQANFKDTDVSYGGGKILLKCICPPNVLSTPKKYSTLWLVDNNDKLIGAKVDLPDWVTPKEGVETWVYINYPVA